jgi:hypothetical protein
MTALGLGCVRTCGRLVVISRFWVLAVSWGGFCGFVDFIGARGPREPGVAVLGGDLAGLERELTPGSAYAAAIAWISGRIPMMFMTRVKL